ncbi:SH2 domain-domain-containing protein [Protomyces lactucae-debilis]|uniref:Transcription elongation factor Spt6 n=1 Tax=Protomyces lactucae-debilis TaxID=2754530 RepID=A0A1Y2FS09_PROLT|nr:SH2 domain-containing protein [Protomyces lactucae-debilis]ORY86367.1 SH2 domain-domain-containing protein [Protomyces lactucae-debilis]
MSAFVDTAAVRDDRDELDSQGSDDDVKPKQARNPASGDDEDEDDDEDDSSEEEDDDDAEEARRVREGFIVDDDEDQKERKRRKKSKNKKKRKHRDLADGEADAAETTADSRGDRRRRAEEDEELDEEDLDLVLENTGEAGSGDRFKRLKRAKEANDLTNIFDEDEEAAEENAPLEPLRTSLLTRGGEFDDFIEDDLSEDDLDRADRERQEARMRNKPAAQARQELTAENVGMDEDAFEQIFEVFGDGEDYADALEDDEDALLEDAAAEGEDLKEIFEPSDLKRRMLTSQDEIIRMTDEPERMQLLRAGFRESQLSDDDFEWLCDWVHQELYPVFLTNKQESSTESIKQNADMEQLHKKAVKDVLIFYTREFVEIPFIWHHRREYLVCKDEREADIADEARIDISLLTLDTLWQLTRLEVRARAILERRDALRKTYAALEIHDEVFEKMIQPERLKSLQQMSDLHDYLFFKYSEQVRDLQAANASSTFKRPASKHAAYERARKSPLYEVVRAFGITAPQFAENFEASTKRHFAEDPEQYPDDLADTCAAADGDARATLNAARDLLVEELIHDPIIRHELRHVYQQAALISVRPTEKGIRKIDELHPYYAFKYAEDLSTTDLRRAPHLMLQMCKAQEERLVRLDVKLPREEQILEQLAFFMHSDNVSAISDEWNRERTEVIKHMMQRMKGPLEKLVVDGLKLQCEDKIANTCRSTLFGKLNRRRPDCKNLDKLEEVARVMAISNGLGEYNKDATVTVIVDEESRVQKVDKYANLNSDDAKAALREQITAFGIDLIGVAGFSPATYKLKLEIEAAILDMDEKDKPSVLYVNDEVARLYQCSPRAVKEYPQYGPLYRYCVALAHYVQSPLHEYVALGRDLLALNLHPQQSLLPEDKLWASLETAIVDVVNIVGVDVNKAQLSSYEENLLPYVSGLGPRKADSLMRRLAQQGGHLKNRTQLLKTANLPKNVFVNCASFLKIPFDTAEFEAARTEEQQEMDILDSTRIHPEDYELANKMAMDAQDLDEEDLVNLAGGPVLLMRESDATDKIGDLILEDYAEELKRAFNQPKLLTLRLIAREIVNPYQDIRRPYHTLTSDELFIMLTGELVSSLEAGSVISATIRRVSRHGLLCKTESGIEVDVAPECLGLPPGADMDPQAHLRVGQAVQGVIQQLDKHNFRATMTLDRREVERAREDAKLKAVEDRNGLGWADFQEESDRALLAAAKEAEARSNRVIKHPLFRQFNARQAEEFLGPLQRGDAVIRPSSKGPDHIAITWKVSDSIFQHLDVLEMGKDKTHSIGRVLRIGKATYSDLDELIVSHVKAMARKVDEMSGHEKFQRGTRQETEQYLTKYSEANPRRSCYAYCFNHQHPGYFDLCFKANPKAQIGSWPVKVVPNAFMMRDNVYADMTSLCNGFKLLFAGDASRQGGRR